MTAAGSTQDGDERFVVGSTSIFERHWGAEDPRFVLVIAHGAGEHSDYWTDVAHAMAAVGATSLGVDFPGHGRSGGVMSLAVDGYVEVLGRVVERARARYPTLPIVLFGHSLGGLVSARFAQAHRSAIDVLVLHAPPLVEMPYRDPSDPSVEDLTPDPVLQQRIADDAFRMTEIPPPEKVAEALRELALGAEQVRAAGALAADLPLVWMHGGKDAAVPFVGARQAFADLASHRAVFLGYPDRGHGGLLESRPEQMLRDLGAAVRFALGW